MARSADRSKNCRNEASPLRVYYTFERLGSAARPNEVQPGAQPRDISPSSARGTTQVTTGRFVVGLLLSLPPAGPGNTRSLASRPPVLRTSSALTPRDAPAFREPHLVGNQAGLALNLRAVRRTSSSLSLKDDLFRANSLSQS